MKKITSALVVLILLAASLSAGEIYHRRAVELRGGLTMYPFMEDPIDWAEQISSSLDEQMEFAPDFGISILYKSYDNFVWNIGFNHMLASRVSYAYNNVDYEESVNLSEFFIMPGFVLNPHNKLNFSIGAGPAIYFASLDRTSPIVGGSLGEFYNAKGRNLGVIGLLNIEYLLSPDFAFKVGGGFRAAVVDNFDFVKSVGGQDVSYPVVWTDGSGSEYDRDYSLDFTGVFAEFGLRWYFEPKRFW